ncbi:MAG: hypothetical protein J6J15_07320 [Oscillospiraceae bacterium]|nr:hypothetical protein [Oscillospiraceae bacterium]
MSILKPSDFLLYSTGTLLAYQVAKDFYGDEHYVWCTESFDAALQPGTSNPRTLCMRYLEQIIKKDRHATEINNNKAGILKGATAKYNAGIITAEQFEQIKGIVAYSKYEDFYPVVYLINKKAVKKRLKIVDPNERASDNSIEYILTDLKRNEFELVRIKDILTGIICPIDD